MKRARELRHLLLFWCLLATTQMFTALWLFSLRYGWTLETIARGHFGGENQAELGWTTWGEIATPHLFAIGTFCFVLAHLLAFVAAKGKQSLIIALSLVISGLAHTLSGSIVLQFGPGFAWVKLGTLIWFEISFALAAWRIISAPQPREI